MPKERAVRSQRPLPPKIKVTPPPTKRRIRGNVTLPVVAQKSAQVFTSKSAKKHNKKPSTPKRLYVLDTNVLMHDPSCIFRFEEHDVLISFQVLEELDNHKKGHEERNRNVREVSRILESIFSEAGENLNSGVPLDKPSGGIATGNLFLQADKGERNEKADNTILNTVQALKGERTDCEVVLVSKDINMRLKARTMGLSVEDYHNDMVLEDTDLLYKGVQIIPEDFWENNANDLQSGKEGKNDWYEMSGPFSKTLSPNEFVYSDSGKKFHAQVVKKEGQVVRLRTINDHAHQKNMVWGITARNREQNYALNLLLDPDIDLVTISGRAGSGKTLLTLAAALNQTLESKFYSEIIFTRITIPVGEEIGFLPGTEEEKMNPWMGALQDNLDFLGANGTQTEKGDGGPANSDWGKAATMDLIRSRVKVKSLAFMRGRTFLKKFVIIDEFQNLTPKQAKTLITRAGPGTKIVCLGNLAQIDTPYLTEGSSGLTYLIERFKGWKHYGHINLQDGERSRLANHANNVL